MTTLEGEWGCKCSCPQLNFSFYFPKMPFYSQNCPFIFLTGPFIFQSCRGGRGVRFRGALLLPGIAFFMSISTLNKNPAHKIILVDCIFGTINKVYNGIGSGKVVPKVKLFELKNFFVQLRISLTCYTDRSIVLAFFFRIHFMDQDNFCNLQLVRKFSYIYIIYIYIYIYIKWLKDIWIYHHYLVLQF